MRNPDTSVNERTVAVLTAALAVRRDAGLSDEDDMPVTQRTVSAANQPPMRRTPGPASIFSVAQPSTWRAPALDLDVDAVTIDRDVGLPEQAFRKSASGMQTLLERLEVGNSAALPKQFRSPLKSAIRHFVAKNHGRKFTIRTTGVDEIRIWRTA